MSIEVNISQVARLASRRKMSVDEVLSNIHHKCSSAAVLELENFDALKKLSDKMLMPVSELLADTGNDLEKGVVIFESGQGFTREVCREGNSFYTYQHLATSNTAPELMALRVRLNCENQDAVVLNSGHDSREIVYILKGVVRFDWREEAAEDTVSRSLNQGDSVYISPGVKHSFVALEEGAELLAFNYEWT